MALKCFVTNFLPKRTRLFLPVLINNQHRNHGCIVNIIRRIYTYKSVHKITDLRNTSCPGLSFSTSGVGFKDPGYLHDDFQGNKDKVQEKTRDQKQIHYVLLHKVPYSARMSDINNFFEDVKMVDKPHIIRFENGNPTGTALLRVADSENVKLCLEKLDSELLNKKMEAEIIDEKMAEGFLGNTILKVAHLPRDWSTYRISKFISDCLLPIRGREKIIKFTFPPATGRIYIVFEDQESKEAAKRMLFKVELPYERTDGYIGRRYLRLVDSNIKEMSLDNSLSVKRAIKEQLISPYGRK